MCVQKVAGASPDRMERQRVKLASPGRGAMRLFLCHTLMIRRADCASGPKRFWTLAEDIILEWEQRKKSRAGGGAPSESRKTCVILGVHEVP